ncbi:MAG: protein-glutamate O-methyltransferase CheR [Candidatus Omnitrophica bacterium]|nr:protein-glutamate O-methyltransferase CheR [Candidatus Omnitrophota bacterium]
MLEITDKEFDVIQELMYRRTGVHLKPTKKPLVMTRLRKRLEELKMTRFTDYIPLVERDSGSEMEIFINALTTNETYFFRHSKQFNYLYEHILPEIVANGARQGFQARIWSGASSSGEEPYSIAITCKEFFKGRPGWKVHLVASDINSEVLAEAKEGLFSDRSIKDVPATIKEKYFKEHVNTKNKMWKEFELSDAIKSTVKFTQHNLLKLFAEKDFDVIFLRNVMIYFDPESKQKVVDNVLASLKPGGHFIISLSESLSDVRTSLTQVYSGIYQKAG